jgi:hypothetical protein
MVQTFALEHFAQEEVGQATKITRIKKRTRMKHLLNRNLETQIQKL